MVEPSSDDLSIGVQCRLHTFSDRPQNCGRPLQSFDDTFRTAMTFLANPQNLWASERIEYKRTVLKLAFSAKLPYCRKEGFRTARISLPFCLLEGLKGGKNEMVPPDRQTSNQILDVLAEWNTYLETHVPYYQELGL